MTNMKNLEMLITPGLLPSFPDPPTIENSGHIIFERIPKVYHLSAFYWLLQKDNTLEIPNYPPTEE